MKEKDGLVDCPEQQLILYVEKEDGTYGPIQTGSYLTRNYIDDYYEKRNRLEASLKDQVARGEISPIAYFMTMVDISESETARRTGLTRRRVRRHMQPGHFGKIPLITLNKYARVFNVPVSDILALWH